MFPVTKRFADQAASNEPSRLPYLRCRIKTHYGVLQEISMPKRYGTWTTDIRLLFVMENCSTLNESFHEFLKRKEMKRKSEDKVGMLLKSSRSAKQNG